MTYPTDIPRLLFQLGFLLFQSIAHFFEVRHLSLKRGVELFSKSKCDKKVKYNCKQ